MNQKRVYFENLNGLRFLSFLSVFLFHSFHTDFAYIKDSSLYGFVKWDLFGNGNIGVNFFFVLSGFLITFLLIEEKKLLGNIDLKKFWARRILRIWPLFYLCVLFGFFVFPILKTMFGQTPNEPASILYYLTFTNNFDFIRAHPDASILGVLWSVAIEEQFYLVWPIILFVLPIKKYWIAFAAVITGSILFIASTDSFLIHQYHTLSCIGDMAVGALGAWLVSENSAFRARLINLKKYQVAGIYIGFLLLFLFRDGLLQFHPYVVIDRFLVAILALAIILEQSYCENSFFKMGRFTVISKLGIISYGLYCYHFVGILITTTLTKKLAINTNIWEVLLLETFFALAITIVISMISYRYFEGPFLKFKKKIEYIST